MAEKQPPAVTEADDWRRKMEEKVADLAQEVERLKSSMPAPDAGQSQEKRSYRGLNAL
jgi:hypothetical protein